MKIKLDKGAYIPTRAHSWDAGLDLYTPVDFEVEAGASEIIDTGVHVQIPMGYVGMIKSKSGLNMWKGIQCEGVIDAGYTGSIVVKVYNNGTKKVTFERGQKLTQLVILPVIITNVDIVDELEETERGSNGFGSTGD